MTEFRVDPQYGKNIVFVANNPKLRGQEIDRYGALLKESVVLHFNTAMNRGTIEAREHWLFLNCNYENAGWFGMKECIRESWVYNEIFIYGFQDKSIPAELDERTARISRIPFQKLKYPDFNTNVQKVVPSAGFIAWDMFKVKYDRIYLLGFTWSGWEFHDWNYEMRTMLGDTQTILLGRR